jgi:hypothetical protein
MSNPGVITNVAGSRDIATYTNALLATLPPIYDRTSTDTILYNLYNALAQELVRADIVLGTVANNNYISVEVTDELIIRGSSGLDRLKNENAFELNAIRLTSPGSQVTQNVVLQVGLNQLQLYYIPESIVFTIYNVADPTQTPLNFPAAFNSSTNILTILSSSQGPFTVSYLDTGNVVRLNQNITVPPQLFMLGYGEGGWNDLGWNE